MPEREEQSSKDPGRRKQALWNEKKARRILKQLDESGEPVEHFARRHGWVPQRLHWWMSKLGWKRSRPATPPTQEPAVKAPQFVPVRVVPDRSAQRGTGPEAQGPGVHIELGGACSIRVAAHFDAQVLRQVVLALTEDLPC